MERLQERIQQAYKALRAFSEVVQLKQPTSIERENGMLLYRDLNFHLKYAGKQESIFYM